MNNTRCPRCGFLNFASAEACMRCGTSLAGESQYESGQPEPGFDPYQSYQQNQWGAPTGAYSYTPPPKHPTVGGGQIAAAIFVVVIACFLRVYLFLDSKQGCGAASLTYELGRFVGYMVVIGVACYVFWRFLLQKTKRKLVLSIFMAGVAALTIWQATTEYNAMKVAKATVRRLISKNGGMAANPAILPKDTSPYPSGRFERVGRTMEDYTIDLHNEAAAYVKDLETLGVDNLLNPNTMVALPSVQQKRLAVAEVIASMDKHEKRIKELAKEGDAAIGAVQVEGCVEREFVAGARMSLTTISQQTTELFTIQRELFKQADQMLAFLEEKTGKYYVENDQFFFHADEDIVRYDSFVERIQQLVAREEDLLRKAEKKQAQAFKGLEEFTR